jgi:molybdate transport system ATP-binding protein
VPRLDLPRGTKLRLRIRARDVVLARDRPEKTSIVNAIPCVVKDIGAEAGPQVDLRLDAGGAALWARITRRSLHELGLVPGSEVYALIKAGSIDRYSLGRSTAAGRFFPDAE